MADELHGALLAVSTRTAGDQLDTNASSGATTLRLDDVSDFDEDGGSLMVGGNVYAYDSVDMDADTIHLKSGLAASAFVGDRVDVWDADTGVVVSEMTALVTVDDQDGDPVYATVDHALTPLLAATTLTAGQSVTLGREGAAHTLKRVHGKNNQVLQRSTADFVQMGIDDGAGNVYGITITPNGSTVRAATLGDFRVRTPDASSYMPCLASAFTVSSDASLKTKPSAPPDALAIIAAAPAKHWRYKTDDKAVKRIGPMADDLPEWLTQVDPEDGTLGLDLARQSGLHHRAIEQLIEQNEQMLARIEALETELTALKKER